MSKTVPNNTLIYLNTTNHNDLMEKFDQCNYNLLFSHLSLSLSFLNQIQFQNFNLQNIQKQFSSSNIQLNHNNIDPSQLQYQQQLIYKLCIAITTFLFGLFYSLIGYRFLKLSTFICGFSLGSSIIYLILSEQKQLTLIENLIISLSIGVLFAFVALLVQYIGLFLLGITSSTAICTCILIIIDLFHGNKSAWVCILLLFVCATIVASITLRFQKSLTILNTCAIGSGLLLISIDFFVENNLLIDYILELYKVNGNSFNMFERQKALLKSSDDFLKQSSQVYTKTTSSTTKLSTTTQQMIKSLNSTQTILVNNQNNNDIKTAALGLVLKLYSSAHARLCWYTWLIFGSFFIIFFLSCLIQFLLTGRNYDHRDSWHKYKGIPISDNTLVIRGSRKKRSANLEKIRLKSHLNDHHHHHHHHHNNHSSLSRNSDIEIAASGHNDTLLLVESGRNNHDNFENHSNTLNYTICSSNESTTGSSCNKKRNRQINDFDHSVEMVSFELLKSPKRDIRKSRVSKENQKLKSSSAKKHSTTNTTSTTSSTSSSASSTCQLIPIKLNHDTNSESTAITTTSNHISGVSPSAPPLVNSQSSIGQPLLPPPVPTLPPPKLPSTLTPQNSTGQFIPTKINHHRNSSSKDRDKDKEKVTGDRFRHLYQIRRNNGDVLSQDFMNNIQNKLSSSSNLNTNESGNSSTSGTNQQQRSSSLNTSDKKKNSKLKK